MASSTRKDIFQYGAPRDPKQGQKGPGATGYGQRTDPMPQPGSGDPSPPSEMVIKFHKNAPTDGRKEDIHHTLGQGPTQAATGDHVHDGNNGTLILLGFSLTGSKSTPSTMWPSILACLVRLGATDNTTA